MDIPRIVDRTGKERDWDWVAAVFGEVGAEHATVTKEQKRAFRAIRLQDAEGPAVHIVRVVDQDGNPLEGIRVVRYWRDAPELPYWQDIPRGWYDRGVFGATNDRGEIGFGTGTGDVYSPPQAGASAFWVAASSGPSDMISGLGILAGSQHRHLNLVFRLSDAKPEEEPSPVPAPVPDPSPAPTPPLPPDPPGDEQWGEVFQKLDVIIRLLEQRVKP